MRIVGGRFRGRVLATPRSQDIRPTTDRTRESLFNILTHGYEAAVEGRRMLDLFAGTGAVGFEALSRGALYVHFVEQSAEGCSLLRANMETLNVREQTGLSRRDATNLGKAGEKQPFDLVFADPPYGQGLGDRALGHLALGGWIAENALVILEENKDVAPGPGDAYQMVEKRIFGDSAMHFYRYRPDALLPIQ